MYAYTPLMASTPSSGISGALLKMSVADDSYVKSHEPPPLTYTAAGLPVIDPVLMSVSVKLFASTRVIT
jgi:hypothetical protein